MRKLSSTAGSDGYGKVSGEVGDSSASSTGKAYYKELIHKANSVPLIRVFKHYNVRADEHTRKIICPFMSHKGGRENSGSFFYYPETNSFCCFGCHTGGQYAHACEFVAAMEDITRAKAALLVLERFANDVDGEISFDGPNYSERLEIMMDFSNAVRNFRQSNFDEKSIAFIEYVSSIYDKLNVRHALDNEALRRTVEQLKEKIISY